MKNLLEVDPNIFAGEDEVSIADSEISDILADTSIMTDFDQENGTDGDKALDKLGSVRCPFNKADIEFWFSQFESQLEVIGVKSQWVKRLALQGILPLEVQEDVKSLLRLAKVLRGMTSISS